MRGMTRRKNSRGFFYYLTTEAASTSPHPCVARDLVEKAQVHNLKDEEVSSLAGNLFGGTLSLSLFGV